MKLLITLSFILTVFAFSSCSKDGPNINEIENTEPENKEEDFFETRSKPIIGKYSSKISGLNKYKYAIESVEVLTEYTVVAANDSKTISVYFLQNDKVTHSKTIDVPKDFVGDVYVGDMTTTEGLSLLNAVVVNLYAPTDPSSSFYHTASSIFYPVEKGVINFKNLTTYDLAIWPGLNPDFSNEYIFFKEASKLNFYSKETGALLKSYDYWQDWSRSNPYFVYNGANDLCMVTKAPYKGYYDISSKKIGLNNGSPQVNWENKTSIFFPLEDSLKAYESDNLSITLNESNNIVSVVGIILSKRWDGSNNLLESTKTITYKFDLTTGAFLSREQK